jgi:hypothetical protein
MSGVRHRWQPVGTGSPTGIAANRGGQPRLREAPL